MIAFLRHVLDARYLYAVQDTDSSGWSAAHTVALLALLVLAIPAARRAFGPRAPDRAPWSTVIAMSSFMSATLLLVTRAFALGALSARIWWISAFVLGLAATAAGLVARVTRSSSVRLLAKSMACSLQPGDQPLDAVWQGLAWVGHVAGMGLLVACREPGLSVVLPVGVLCIFVSAVGASPRMRRRLRIEALTPFAFVYATAALRWLVRAGLGVDTGPYAAFPFPDPWSPFFDPQVTNALGIAWTLLSTAALVCRGCRIAPDDGARWLGAAVLVGALLWYAVTVARHRSHGATGSDPYCYLQMASDMARTGTVLHAFPLADLAREAGVTVWPIAHVGYHPPSEGGLTATVWPIGWPLLLAPFLWLGGEALGMWVASAFVALSALLLAATAIELSGQGRSAPEWLVGGLAGGLILTSAEVVTRSLVPMADAAAQCLSVATLFCLLRARRRDGLAWSALAGASLGWAYFVRHGQLFLLLGTAPTYGLAQWPRRRKAQHLFTYFLSALAFALPDLAYHTCVFGSPWSVESTEWSLLSLANVWPNFIRILRDGWLRRNEFGHLLILAFAGVLGQRRNLPERGVALGLWLSIAGVLVFHLSYGPLRLRDLLALFPLATLIVARGITSLWERAGSGPMATNRRAAVLLFTLFLLCARTAGTLAMPTQARVAVFGHLSPEERAAFASLADDLPPGAVLGAGLNSGALERYARVTTVRPAAWSEDEIASVVHALDDRGTPLYLLDDSEEMTSLVVEVSCRYDLLPLKSYVLPDFGRGGEQGEGVARLYLLRSR